MFLNEVEEILNVMDDSGFRDVAVPLFKHIALCFASEHFQVAERALYLWSNDHIVSLVADSIQQILPVIYKVLYYNSNNHWHKSIRSLSFSSLKLFLEIDPALYATCAQKYRLEEEQQRARVTQVARSTPVPATPAPTPKTISASTGPSLNASAGPDEKPKQETLYIRRKSLLPVDASTLEALSTHRSLEDVVQQEPTATDIHLQGEGEIVDLNAPYSDEEGYDDRDSDGDSDPDYKYDGGDDGDAQQHLRWMRNNTHSS